MWHLVQFYIRRSPGAMLVAGLCGLASGAITALLVAMINNILLGHQSPDTSTIVWFLIWCALRLIAGIISHLLLIQISQSAVRDLRISLSQQILEAPLAHLEIMGNGRLMGALTDDVARVADAIVNVPYFCVNVVVLAGCGIYLGILSPVMLGVIASALVIGALSYWVPIRWANSKLRTARRLDDELFGHFESLVGGVKELKQHRNRREVFLQESVIPSAEASRAAHIQGISTYAAAANWNRLLFFLYVGALVFAGPPFLGLRLSDLPAYVLVLLYMMAPLEAILNALPHMARANAALEHTAELGLSLAERAEDQQSDSLFHDFQQLELQDITYRYKKSSEAFQLGPVDLKLTSGEIVFLIGGNGCGKTTLAKVLTGLYATDSGIIRINGKILRSEDLVSYRDLFAVVFSEFYLFAHVTSALDHDPQINELIELLELTSHVQIQNGRFSTTELSRGQRKRLALLTAILDDRPVYVFDEWAADQDPHFRQKFYHQILPVLRGRGKAVLAITHDDRYFHIADRIVKLDQGRIISMDQSKTIEPLPIIVRAQ